MGRRAQGSARRRRRAAARLIMTGPAVAGGRGVPRSREGPGQGPPCGPYGVPCGIWTGYSLLLPAAQTRPETVDGGYPAGQGGGLTDRLQLCGPPPSSPPPRGAGFGEEATREVFFKKTSLFPARNHLRNQHFLTRSPRAVPRMRNRIYSDVHRPASEAGRNTRINKNVTESNTAGRAQQGPGRAQGGPKGPENQPGINKNQPECYRISPGGPWRAKEGLGAREALKTARAGYPE